MFSQCFCHFMRLPLKTIRFPQHLSSMSHVLFTLPNSSHFQEPFLWLLEISFWGFSCWLRQRRSLDRKDWKDQKDHLPSTCRSCADRQHDSKPRCCFAGEYGGRNLDVSLTAVQLHTLCTQSSKSLFINLIDLQGMVTRHSNSRVAMWLCDGERLPLRFTQQFGLDEDCVSQLKQQPPSVVSWLSWHSDTHVVFVGTKMRNMSGLRWPINM